MLRPDTTHDRLRSVVRDLRWETRLLALVAAILVVFGLTAVYGASSLLTISGGQVGSSFALKQAVGAAVGGDRKSTRLNSSHVSISYAVFCLKKKNDGRDRIQEGQHVYCIDTVR